MPAVVIALSFEVEAKARVIWNSAAAGSGHTNRGLYALARQYCPLVEKACLLKREDSQAVVHDYWDAHCVSCVMGILHATLSTEEAQKNFLQSTSTYRWWKKYTVWPYRLLNSVVSPLARLNGQEFAEKSRIFQKLKRQRGWKVRGLKELKKVNSSSGCTYAGAIAQLEMSVSMYIMYLYTE